MMEEQAASRVHRLGQTREVTVNHYIVKDSVEEVSSSSISFRIANSGPSQRIKRVQTHKIQIAELSVVRHKKLTT